jgi:hypothetical protein
MNQQDNDYDLKLLQKRIISLSLFLLVVLGGEYIVRRTKLFTSKTKEVLIDSIYVRANDANMSLVIVKYDVVIDTDKMYEYSREMYKHDEESFLHNELLIPIREELRTAAAFTINFSQPDILKKYRELTERIVKSGVQLPKGNGITVNSYSVEILHEQRVLSLLLVQANKDVEIAKANMEAARIKAEAMKLKDPKIREKMMLLMNIQRAEIKLQDSLAKVRKN